MYQYPYGNAQQLNLDWLMEQWQEVKQSIDGSLQGEIDRVEAAITDLLAARDAAVAAAGAANTSAGAAAASAQAAAADAATATAQAAAATQERVNAAQAANNAQVYANTAQAQATAAGNSANAAAISKNNAQNSELAAAASSSAAAGNALYSEGFAVGEQNGNPVSSSSPYYENNAKYYAEEAANSAAALVNYLPEKTIENVAIASFPDGAGGMPLKSINVQAGVSVTRTGKNLFNINRTVGTPTPADISASPRVMSENNFYVGLRADNYYYSQYITNYSVANGTIKVTTTNNFNYGLGFPVPCKPNTQYTLTATITKGQISIGCYDSDWNFISTVIGMRSDYPKTFTTPTGAAYITIVFGSVPLGEEGTFSNIQLEIGSQSTAYNDFEVTTFLDPSLVTTLNGYNNIWASSGNIIELTYYADPTIINNEAITHIKAIIAKEEKTYNATQAYNVNDFLIVDDTLYIVTAAIANGGAITPNTNVIATTIGNQITAILNS